MKSRLFVWLRVWLLFADRGAGLAIHHELPSSFSSGIVWDIRCATAPPVPPVCVSRACNQLCLCTCLVRVCQLLSPIVRVAQAEPGSAPAPNTGVLRSGQLTLLYRITASRCCLMTGVKGDSQLSSGLTSEQDPHLRGCRFRRRVHI
jgi:hypothetical protein